MQYCITKYQGITRNLESVYVEIEYRHYDVYY